ncbi:MAG: DnaJ domain-containing protein [Cyanobacteriota/Melainabacteria group bacterium]
MKTIANAKQDYYETIELPKDSSAEEIKKNLSKESSSLHPDNKGGDERPSKLAEAYEVLSDEQKRQPTTATVTKG